MFHTGDLQSGIATALRDSKMVACFVKDDGEESKTWEEDWLKIDEVAEMLSMKTVSLKLQGGSQDAGYLAAICPIPKTPTLVIIHNGQLKEYIISGVTREVFISRLTAVLKEESAPAKAHVEPPQESQEIHEAGSSHATLSSDRDQFSERSTAPVTTVPSTQSSRSTRDRLKTQQLPVESEQESNSAPNQDDEDGVKPIQSKAKKSSDTDHATLLKKRQKEAREERARILKRVENDKTERRTKDAERKAEIATTNSGPKSSDTVSSTTSSSSSKQCAVQVRLFDGSTIRSRFSSSDTLRTNVRRWIDEQKEGDDTPYSFREVRIPYPNRIISIHEEEESLQSIGLIPSATLILVPIKEYASAYGNSEQGLLSKGASVGYNLISSSIGLVTGAFGSLLTRSEGPTPSGMDDQQTRISVDSALNSNARVRTLRDQRDTQEDQQLYNGNTLNFEPRRDSEDDKME